jgi:hypothetical protein
MTSRQACVDFFKSLEVKREAGGQRSNVNSNDENINNEGDGNTNRTTLNLVKGKGDGTLRGDHDGTGGSPRAMLKVSPVSNFTPCSPKSETAEDKSDNSDPARPNQLKGQQYSYSNPAPTQRNLKILKLPDIDISDAEGKVEGVLLKSSFMDTK